MIWEKKVFFFQEKIQQLWYFVNTNEFFVFLGRGEGQVRENIYFPPNLSMHSF